jgi:hypothetical protein
VGAMVVMVAVQVALWVVAGRSHLHRQVAVDGVGGEAAEGGEGAEAEAGEEAGIEAAEACSTAA